jgi:hypothetical protein
MDFLKDYDEKKRQIRAEIRKAFSMIDHDGSGSLSAPELGEALIPILQYTPSEFEVKRILDLMDQDRNGVITEDEFVSAIETWLAEDDTDIAHASSSSSSSASRKRARNMDDSERVGIHMKIQRFLGQVRQESPTLLSCFLNYSLFRRKHSLRLKIYKKISLLLAVSS